MDTIGTDTSCLSKDLSYSEFKYSKITAKQQAGTNTSFLAYRKFRYSNMTEDAAQEPTPVFGVKEVSVIQKSPLWELTVLDLLCFPFEQGWEGMSEKNHCYSPLND